MKKVDVFVKGPGSGRETAIRSLQATGLEVGSIQDVTPQAPNGCRPPKRRRVKSVRPGSSEHWPNAETGNNPALVSQQKKSRPPGVGRNPG